MCLDKDGYVILKDVLNDQDVDKALHCADETGKINYGKMKQQFIDGCFFRAIKQAEPRFSNPIYAKFRYSNNNNSTDASTFHGDIYNHSDEPILPIYTCLCYFDDAEMELIPGSHLKNEVSTLDSFNKKIVNKLNRGDVLVFHSNIHHRGINFSKTENRRLLQVFDVFPDKKTYDSHFDKLIVVKTDGSAGETIKMLSKNETAINIVNFFHYLLVHNDMQYKIALSDLSPAEKKGKYISYEPGKRKSLHELTDAEENNVNIVCDKNLKTVNSSNYYLQMFFLFLLVLVAAYVIYNGIIFNKSKPSKFSSKRSIRT
jgi:hypothetical protein